MNEQLESIGRNVVDCALTVHRNLGPGLLESVYKREHVVDQQVLLPINYDGQILDTGFRLDLRIDRLVIVEVKSVEKLHPVVEAQILTYLRLTELRLGFVINFNVPLVKDGIRRYAR